MAYYERDYYRNPAHSRMPMRARMNMFSFTTWLIIINVVVFVLGALMRNWAPVVFNPMAGYAVPMSPLQYWGHFSAELAIERLQLWRFITCQFLHANLMHLLMNMLGLYFFGPMVESFLGSRRYLAFYLLCGVAGALTYLILLSGGALVGYDWVPLVGASGGIFGILLAGAHVAPDTRVMLLIPPIPLKLRTLAWVLFGIAALTVLSGGANAGGQAAHLGGAVLGLLLIRRPHWLDVFARFSLPRPSSGRGGGGRGGGMGVGRGGGGRSQPFWRSRAKNGAKPDADAALDREVDHILEKVNRHGLQSLSGKEKRTLQRASEVKRDG